MTVQSDVSVRNASITAEVGLLLMSVLNGFGNFLAVVGLVTQRDAAQQPKTSQRPASSFSRCGS
jgi:hypothetical protein